MNLLHADDRSWPLVTVSMRVIRVCLMLVALGMPGSWLSAQTTDSKRTVLTLEISGDPRGALGSQQKWMEMLQQVGADRVTSRTSRTGVAAIEEKETDTAIMIRVQGFIDKNRLELPGGKFAIHDVAGIKALLEKFRDNGAEITLSDKKAFGLTAKELVWLHAKLSVPVDLKTQGTDAGQTVAAIAKRTGLTFDRDRLAQTTLATPSAIGDELEGLSAGTALAAILRPLGLVMQPVRYQGTSIKIQIRDAVAGDEHWPVGWPLEQAPISAEPKLFEKMPINIKNFPLDQVMAAVQKRAGVPFLYDHNTLAREGLELSQTKVTVVQENSTLLVTIGKILRQTKPRLSEEIRVDERGKAFLWISVR